MSNNQNTIKPGMNSDSKARFFALYWGQPIQTYKLTYSWRRNVNVDGSSSGFIELTSLSDITDEQLIECCKYKNEMSFITRKSWRVERKDHYALISSRISSHSFAVDFVSGDVEFYNDDEIEVTISDATKDYLRSIGAACPFMNYSVEDMVLAGWIKLKGGK